MTEIIAQYHVPINVHVELTCAHPSVYNGLNLSLFWIGLL